MKPFTTLAVAMVATVSAAPAAAQTDTQAWAAAFASGPVRDGGRVLVWWDAHARFREEGDRLDTTILRPGVGWRVSPRLDLWAGYAHVTLRRPGPDGEEHRAWQQATYPIAGIAGGRLTGRTRIEQRFREGGDDTGWRVRQFVRWSRPVAWPAVSVVLSNETFVGLNETDWGQGDGYDQNRAFAGVGWQVTPTFRLEGGYMHQRINGGSAPDRKNDNLVLSGFTTF
ncbi:DUF2490 domain-containing protein [Brevundimonas subvibrioides]|uniref:DUF2490 domain-containing protein n=1 Tax=Brevundimonas subvibrioides (strain ATCC 15264 / DSM 4735 / LMG 14903 / NBRC 16000 / CB 81) TaxID=633149 RepID=D9QLQ9_BRESC|nr:DUF2490 domain-containing protein [Brevundimonas subvibrioides]ADK99992.1 Protein of unknown function DUF2490 [Brevundimonas subvibrioides ATCC 15264]